MKILKKWIAKNLKKIIEILFDNDGSPPSNTNSSGSNSNINISVNFYTKDTK